MVHDDATNPDIKSLRTSLPWIKPRTQSRFDRVTSAIDSERDRWILWIVVAFGAGTAIYFSLHNEPELTFGPLMFVALLGLMFALPRHTLITVLLGLLLSIVAGFTAAKMKTEWVRAPVFAAKNNAVTLTGDIELIEPRDNGAKRLTIRPTRISELSNNRLPDRLRVTVAKRMADSVNNLRTADTITVRAKLSPPSGPVIPGGYDFARYAWFKGIGAVGYALSTPKSFETTDPTNKISKIQTRIAATRRYIGDKIHTALPTETGAIANALITGERGAISDETNQAYRDAGLYHVLSISGLHMAIMAGAVFYALRTLFAAIPMIALTQPIKKWAAIGAILGAFAYLLISGGAFATIRSFIMISIMFVAILLDRPAIALRNVATAALIILVFFPESILDPGFQMSFAAVSALVAGFEVLSRSGVATDDADRSNAYRWFVLPLLAIIFSTVIASLAVAPFAIYHFNNAQHFAVIANIIAMPACNLIVMPAALGTLIAIPIGLEVIPLAIMGHGIDAMTWTAKQVAALPAAVSHPPAMPPHSFALIVLGGLLLLIVRNSVRYAGLALVAIGIAAAPLNQLPDVLIGRDGALVAIKTKNGNLGANLTDPTGSPTQTAATIKNRAPYELSRWMEHYGDSRPPEIALKTRAFKCDALGCATVQNGLRIAVPTHLAAYSDDCRTATIIITKHRAPNNCNGPELIIDQRALRRYGPHAIHIFPDQTFKVLTTAQQRGNRPWVQRTSR